MLHSDTNIKYSHTHTHTHEKRNGERPESPTALGHYGNTVFDPSNYLEHPNPKVEDEINPFVLYSTRTHTHKQTNKLKHDDTTATIQ